MSGVLLWLGVGVGGGLGAVARFVVDRKVLRVFGVGQPAGIFVVNVTGAFLLGLVVGAALSRDATLLAGTAVLGAYTTFSTWMLDTQRVAPDGRRGLAAANLVGSVVFGLLAAALGRALAG